MAENKTLEIVAFENAPAVHVSGEGEDLGTVSLKTIEHAIDLARGAYSTVDELTLDDFDQVRDAIKLLSDGLSAVAGELYQVGRGIRMGRITIEPLGD